MLLVIDAGNTNTVFALYDGADLKGKWRISSDGQRTADEYSVWLSQVLTFDSLALSNIHAAIISSVVPPVLPNLTQFCEKVLKCDPLIVGSPQVALGLDVRIDEPSAVGADRLANAVGAHAKFSGALIVLDFGTATTLDIIARDGAYEGGVIAPGVNLSVEALHMAAAKLPPITVERPDKVIGRTTIQAMQSGVFWGYISMIEGLVARIKEEYGEPATVIATGGLSRLFHESTAIIEYVEEDLTIEGLRILYERNEKT